MLSALTKVYAREPGVNGWLKSVNPTVALVFGWELSTLPMMPPPVSSTARKPSSICLNYLPDPELPTPEPERYGATSVQQGHVFHQRAPGGEGCEVWKGWVVGENECGLATFRRLHLG
ncbi:hypothetical protein GQ457_01G025890 [Hibiscus cannabinus]